MKVFKLIVCSVLIAFSIQSSASWDIYKSGLIINSTYLDCQMGTAAPDFQNHYFGRFTTSGSLVLEYAEVLTYKNGASNVCGANLQYRVYRTSDTPGSFQTLSTNFCCNQGGTDCFGGGCGPDVNNPGDQKWKNTTIGTTNLISALTLPGTYVIEVYYDATGDDSGGCTNTKYSSNGGLNFRAYFEFGTNDNFTDLDFSTPTWSGDNANFTVIANSNTSGLTGSEAYRTHTVRLNASGSGTESISTQIATWDSQQEWYFWLGRNGNGGAPQDFDANNQQAVYLYSTTSNLESGSCNGYRILMGENTTSYIRLQRIDSGVATTIFTSATGIPNGLTDYGVSFKVTRSQLGVWTVRTSTLPTNGTNTQTTPDPNAAPETTSAVNHGSVTDNTYAPAINGYFGFQATHDSSTEGVQAAEFDSFRFVALPPNTYVQINGSVSGSVAEDVAFASNHAIGVDIFNPSGTQATSVDLVLLSGSAGRAGRGLTAATAYSPSYTTVTLTWSAGQTGTKYIYIDPDDNNLCDDVATLAFQLQNATGGTNAFVGPAADYSLSIVDDNMGYETLLSENFNSGALTNWVTTGTSWSASTGSPIEGTHSARHSNQGSAGTSSLVYPMDGNNLVGINTTWRFEVNFQNDATANNNFQAFLAASENDLSSATVDGYAVVVDQSSLPSAGSSDYIRLYRVDNGAYASTPIVNSAIDWINDVNSGTLVSFEVTLSDAGTWNLKIDDNGGFNSLSSLGTGTDLMGGGLTYPISSAFGMRFKYLPGASDLFRFDEVTISQSGCKELWYSQGTGNSDGAVWDNVVSGTGQTVVSGRYDRFVIQSGHNITANGTWLTRSVGINSGGTLTGGTATVKVFESWVNDGTFTSGSSNVVFKGQTSQSILGTNPSAFNNLTIDNDGSSVTIVTAATVKGVVSMEEGTLQTGGILTLISNSTGSASIGEIKSGASVSGNITLQRYAPSIPTVYGNWMNLGCPLTGQTIADWDDDMTTTGFTASDYPSYPFNNIQYYNESASGTMNTGYVGVTNETNTIDVDRGYFVWLQGVAQNIDNTGAIQSGSFTKSLSYTITTPGGIFDYGWNLMSNPYPSEVDWNLVSSTLTGPRVYYVFDYETNAYKYHNATTNSGTASRYIPHSQSFLVKVNAAGQSLAYQENYKTNNGTAFERSEDTENSFISMQLSRNGMSDESMLMFSAGATGDYDELDVFDLESINADAVEFSLMSSDNVGLAQDVRPFDNAVSIPVYLDLPSAGTYTFSVVEVQNLPFGSCLYVEDISTGNSMTLAAGESMNIVTDAPFQGNRLIIHASAPVAMVITDASCNGETDGSLDVTTPSGNWSISLAGELDNYEYVSSGSITFDHLAAGQYELQVNNTDGGCGSHSTVVTIGEPILVTSSVIDVAPVLCNEGHSGHIEWTVNNATWYAYDIVDSQGNVVIAAEAEGHTGFAEGLAADLYTIHIYTTCSTETLAADLRDPHADVLVVEVPALVYIENDVAEVEMSAVTSASVIHWTLSNGLEGMGDQFSATLTEPGVYGYVVTATSNCTLSQSGTFTVAISTGLNEIASSDELIISKQFSNGVQLTFNHSLNEQAVIRVFDMNGREVISRRTAVVAGQNAFINLEQFSTGIYSIQVIAADAKVFATQVYKR